MRGSSSNSRARQLVAVVDADIERARLAGNHASIAALTTIDDLPADVEAAIVAVPTAAHLRTASELVRRGIHVLVEKPLAPSVADAEQIVEAALAANVTLAVGHIERFNPAIIAMTEFVSDPLHIDASRISPFSNRISDGVVFDLMIHDIDIACSLAGPDAVVSSVSGVGRALRGPTEDMAYATISFDNGVTASLATSRLGQQKIRAVEVTQGDSVITADLVRSDVTIYRMAHHEYLGDQGASYRQSSVVEIPFIQQRGEPLALELADFVSAVQNRSSPRVGGVDGVRAVGVAAAIVKSLIVSS